MAFASRYAFYFNLFFLLIFSTSSAAETGSAPSAVVRQFQSGLLSVMKDADRLTVQERYERLVPLIEESYHLGTMIRVASSGYWTQTTDDQKHRLLSAFKRMGGTTLATLFSGYSGESFDVLGERPGPQETVIVASQVVRPEKPPIAINYVTRQFGGRWYVIDVILDNSISELTVRQSEYRAVLQKGGIEALISLLDGKANELAAR